MVLLIPVFPAAIKRKMFWVDAVCIALCVADVLMLAWVLMPFYWR